MTDYGDHVGKRIRALRKAHGMTQTTLAAKVELNKTSLLRLEHGTRNMLVKELPLFAEALDVTIEDLLGHHPLTVERKVDT